MKANQINSKTKLMKANQLIKMNLHNDDQHWYHLGGAWCNRVVAKQDDFHSTAPAYKQINEWRSTQPPSKAENEAYLGTPMY